MLKIILRQQYRRNLLRSRHLETTTCDVRFKLQVSVDGDKSGISRTNHIINNVNESFCKLGFMV